VRVSAGVFRERLERAETTCRVTGIMDRRYLQATHIKPWKDADDREARWRQRAAAGTAYAPAVEAATSPFQRRRAAGLHT